MIILDILYFYLMQTLLCGSKKFKDVLKAIDWFYKGKDYQLKLGWIA